jgi:hypothetical protein
MSRWKLPSDPTSRWSHPSSDAHTTIWKLIPVGLSRQAGPVYFALRRRRWNPLSRTRYSREGLAERRWQLEAAMMSA